ncbi:MAG: nucleotidyl transferase AbiEii/AbiGii toxin family protein [bacterium]
MTQKTFLNKLSNGNKDIVQEVIDLMDRLEINYCVIGGLAVNAYVEPVVSLDLDIVVIGSAIERFIIDTKEDFKIERFEHSINLSSKGSDIRIQIQTDERYQDFIERAFIKNIMGYQMKVASLRDILQGKTWAYLDKKRRGSKRQKDLADIMRIIESYPELKSTLPDEVLNSVK